MIKLKQMIKRYLFLPVGWVIVHGLALIIGLPLCFYGGRKQGILDYIFFGYSAYALTVVLIGMPKIVRNIRYFSRNNRVVKKIQQYPLGKRYFEDLRFRTMIWLTVNFVVNLFYVVLKFAYGWYFSSVWFFAMGVYYLMLSVIRIYLMRQFLKLSQIESDYDRRIHEVVIYRNTGWLLFLLNVTMAGMIVQMVTQNKGYEYPGVMVYGSAMFAFYFMIMAVYNMIKYRKMNHPLLSGVKVISFLSAVMSMFALQTAMITQFGSDDTEFRQLANTLTGTAVALISFGMAVFMVRRGNKILAK